jgi:hypothetical protein
LIVLTHKLLTHTLLIVAEVDTLILVKLILVNVGFPEIVHTFNVDTERVVPVAVVKEKFVDEALLVYIFFAEIELQLTCDTFIC